jgi:hypothetical protein
MNRLIFNWLCLLGCMEASAQGYIDFKTYVGDGREVNAPVFRPDGSGAGTGFTAGLFLVRAEGSLEPLFPTTTFKTSSPQWTPYVRDVPIFLPGTWSGDVVTVRMRAWETAAGSYEAALIRGESNDIQVTLHAGFPMTLIGLQGFTMVLVPEPGPGVLLVLGGGLWLLAARRRTESNPY